MIVAAAVCPHPPMLVPQLAAGAAAELDDLRRACDEAVAALAAHRPDTLVVVGVDGPRYLDFAPWGVDVAVGPGQQRLPLSLLVGEWLLARHGWAGHDRLAVPVDGTVAACVDEGARLAADHRRLALLVMADGSCCHGPRAPGYDDPRAGPYDRAVAGALAAADGAALVALDPALSGALGATGRAPWQVLAGAVRASGGRWRGQLRYDQAPYGVGYFVASWDRS